MEAATHKALTNVKYYPNGLLFRRGYTSQQRNFVLFIIVRISFGYLQALLNKQISLCCHDFFEVEP